MSHPIEGNLEVCHLADTDFSGGAARAAYMLHRGLSEAGVTSSMIVREKRTNDRGVHPIQARMDWASRLQRRIARDRRAHRYHVYSEAAARGNDCLLNPPQADFANLPAQLPRNAVINMHWVAGCIDVPTFFAKGGAGRRYVWTMHDMWPMTGACHYSSGCTRFTGECGACPQILSTDPLDVTHEGWLAKRVGYGALKDHQLTVVTPSSWLGNEARRSTLLKRFDVRVIPNGIDLDAFAPRDRRFSRETLGIPQNAFVIAFLADVVTGRRKGFHVLQEALEKLSVQNDVWLISVGSGTPTVPERYGRAHFGRVDNSRLLSLFYSAADVFVTPTLEDNLPTTVIESLACGTPVIGSDVGGVPDMVRAGQTGFLFPTGDANALAELLRRNIEAPVGLASLRPLCRDVAERDYSVAQQARRYAELYREIQSR